jgi:DNA-binding CsgD family transcriptional regulator/PAS domain-containing protein
MKHICNISVKPRSHPPDGLREQRFADPMDNEKLLANLTGRLYDAALGADSWDSTLDAIMTAVGAEVSALFIEDHSDTDTVFETTAVRGYPDHVPSLYTSYFGDRDVRLPAVLRVPSGQIYADDRNMSFAEIEQSEIYNDFYRPIGVARGMAAVAFNDRKRLGILSVHRAIRAGNFRQEDAILFERISPHLKRALQLHSQVARTNAVADGLAIALGHFHMGVFLVDQRGETIEFNPAAESLLRRPGCPLRLMAKRLSAVSSHDSALVARAIADAACASQDRPSRVPPVLRLPKTDGIGALGVMMVPARRADKLGLLSGGRLVLVFVSDPGQAPPTRPELLVRQFNLSPAEAEVAARLAAGDRIEDIANTRDVSHETVRVQVKRVLAKTETGSQGQLIALLSRSLAALRRP